MIQRKIHPQKTQKPKNREEQIAERLTNMPESWRKTYLKAVGGKNRAAGVKAFCQECVGYERAEVTACTDRGCPLWLYRPYRFAKNVNSERFEGAESTNGLLNDKSPVQSLLRT